MAEILKACQIEKGAVFPMAGDAPQDEEWLIDDIAHKQTELSAEQIENSRAKIVSARRWKCIVIGVGLTLFVAGVTLLALGIISGYAEIPAAFGLVCLLVFVMHRAYKLNERIEELRSSCLEDLEPDPEEDADTDVSMVNSWKENLRSS